MAENLVFGPEIQQMMHVAGEKECANLRTLYLIETIIKEQVIHMITRAGEIASHRGNTNIYNHDIIFQFRHDEARVAQIQRVLHSKILRKIPKDDEEDLGKMDSEAADELQSVAAESSKAAVAAPKLPWDISSMYGELPPGPIDSNDSEEQDLKTLERLRAADAKTEAMSVDEYKMWTEYRKASFTKRRGNKFPRWCGLNKVDLRKEDVLDILGFLISQMVQRLTEIALSIQDREMRSKAASGGEESEDGTAQSGKNLAPPFGTAGKGERKAIDCSHIQQAYDQIQMQRKGIWAKKGLRLI